MCVCRRLAEVLTSDQRRKKMAAAGFGCDQSGNEGIEGREKQPIVEVTHSRDVLWIWSFSFLDEYVNERQVHKKLQVID